MILSKYIIIYDNGTTDEVDNPESLFNRFYQRRNSITSVIETSINGDVMVLKPDDIIEFEKVYRSI